MDHGIPTLETAEQPAGADTNASLCPLDGLPIEWVRDSLVATGTESVRVRRLTAEATVLLVIAMGVLRDRSITDVANDLKLVRSKPGEPPIESGSISDARKRLGDEPLAHLATRCGHWAREAASTQKWRALSLFGIDGTTLRAADTPENRAYFGGQSAGAKHGTSGYPLVRLVALVALRSHLLAALAVDSYKTSSELSLAPALLDQVPDHSLVILDRCFRSARLLINYMKRGISRHWLVRARVNTVYKTVRRFSPRDELVDLPVHSEARRLDPTLPMSYRVRAIRYQRRGFQPQLLLTSLLDPERWPAYELVELYHERWECELAFDEIKTEQLNREEALRSRAPWSVRQEVYGLMLGYNLVRRRAIECARWQRTRPVQVSFVAMLRGLRDRWTVLAIMGETARPRLDAHARQQARRARLPARRSLRTYPRAVKLKVSCYPRKRPVARCP